MSGAADKAIDGRDPVAWGLTRAELLRRGAAGALVLGAGGLLGGEAASAAVARALAPPKRGGTLRIGIAGGSPTDDFDMAHVNGPSSTVRDQVFYETVTFLDGRFNLHDDFLCRECTPNATADSWTVRLKQGIEFHNGKTLTADDLLFSIKRLLNPKSGATAAGQLVGIDLARTRKRDTYTVGSRSSVRTRSSTACSATSSTSSPSATTRATGQHRAVGVQELHARAADGSRPLRELPRHAGLRRPADPDRAARRLGPRERSDQRVRSTRSTRSRSRSSPSSRGSRPYRSCLADRRLEPDHHAGRHAAVRRRSRPPGDPALHGSPQAIQIALYRPGRPRGGQLWPLRSCLRRVARAAPGHRAGEVAAQAGRQQG